MGKKGGEILTKISAFLYVGVGAGKGVCYGFRA
jgi:hypothetical protein